MTSGVPGDGLALGDEDFRAWWGCHCALVGVVPCKDMTAMAFASWKAAPGPLDMDRFERFLDRLEQVCEARRIKDAPHPTRDRLLASVHWVLGQDGDFRTRAEGEGAFWWRPELRRRCGL